MAATERGTGAVRESNESAAHQPTAAIAEDRREFAGVTTRVLEALPPARLRQTRHPRLILLHGYCDSADTWRPALAELAAAGAHAIAVDLPGFGAAGPLRAGSILPQLDAFVAELLTEQAQYGPVFVVGNSLGGTLSLRAAQDHRLPVTGVVSIAAPGLVDGWLVRTVGRNPLPLRLYSALPVPVPGFPVRAVADQVVPRLLYADAAHADTDQVRRFTELFPDYRATRTRLAQAQQLVGELASAYQLDQIRVPLLVVACGKDRLVSTAAGRKLHALVPHSRLLVRAPWGHCPQLDAPADVAELLRYFTASVSRAGTGGRRQRAGGSPTQRVG